MARYTLLNSDLDANDPQYNSTPHDTHNTPSKDADALSVVSFATDSTLYFLAMESMATHSSNPFNPSDRLGNTNDKASRPLTL